jgi:Bacterial RNA polymerase, alpha chain C terminal domain
MTVAEHTDVLKLPIMDIEWISCDVRIVNALRADGILTLGDLLPFSEVELRRIPNLGRKSLNSIKETLAAMNLQLGAPPPQMLQQNNDDADDAVLKVLSNIFDDLERLIENQKHVLGAQQNMIRAIKNLLTSTGAP